MGKPGYRIRGIDKKGNVKMNTLKDLIISKKIRKGKAHGITKHGAFWTPSGANDFFVVLRSAGGDGIGQNAPDVTYYLDFRHYRNGQVSAKVCRKAWHQNGEYSGAGTSWLDVSEILNAQSVEEVIAILKGKDLDGSAIISDQYARNDLTPALIAFGLVESLPAPDEVIA